MLIMCFFAHKSLPNLLFVVLCLPGDQSHPVCTTVNKPSCVLHLLDWFIGSRGFSSLERRPEFWVLHMLLGYFHVWLFNPLALKFLISIPYFTLPCYQCDLEKGINYLYEKTRAINHLHLIWLSCCLNAFNYVNSLKKYLRQSSNSIHCYLLLLFSLKKK